MTSPPSYFGFGSLKKARKKNTAAQSDKILFLGVLLFFLGLVFWLAVYGAFANFFAVFLAALTGAGKMTPIAGGQAGAPVLEGVISFLLISLALAMLAMCGMLLYGLYKPRSGVEKSGAPR